MSLGSLKIGLGVTATATLAIAAIAWRAEEQVTIAPAQPAPLTPAASEARRTWPSSRTALSPADLHEKVWSAPDVLTAVRDAQRNGTPDEKLWAAEAAHECWFLLHAGKGPLPPPLVLPKPPTPSQASARAELDVRCSGFKTVPRGDRQALEKELRDGAASSTSDYAQLHAIAQVPWHHPLSDTELALVEQAFYGPDPLLRRDAVYAMAGAIKDQDRTVSMLAALSDAATTPLSTFEVLEQCVFIVERCGSQQHAILDSEPAVTPEQLRQQAEIDRIRAAVANKMPVAELIALQ
jgi:hypothetical protein